MFKQIVNSRNVLLFSWLVFLLSIILNYIGLSNICFKDYSCLDTLSLLISFIILLVGPFAIISIIIFFFRKEVFFKWFYFSLVWIPFYLFLVFISPADNGHGGYVLPTPSTRETVTLIGPIIYTILSLLIILFKSIQLHKKK